MKKTISIATLFFAMTIVLSGCGNTPESSNSNVVSKTATNKNSELNSCYEECERFGGGTENIKMCKENCDASSNEDSVWNQTDEEVAAENDATFSSWSKVPSEVPEFKYGTFVAGEEGMGSWIVDFKNVSADALKSYVDDLKNAGWSASGMEITGMINGSYEGEKSYTIAVNIDKEEKEAQIIVRKANK